MIIVKYLISNNSVEIITIPPLINVWEAAVQILHRLPPHATTITGD
jgi:hypothetical protein